MLFVILLSRWARGEGYVGGYTKCVILGYHMKLRFEYMSYEIVDYRTEIGGCD